MLPFCTRSIAGHGSRHLATKFPDRKVYQWVQRADPGDSILRPSSLMEPVVLKSGPTVTLRYDVTSNDRSPVVVGYVSVNGDVAQTQVLDRHSTLGKNHRFNCRARGAEGSPRRARRPTRSSCT